MTDKFTATAQEAPEGEGLYTIVSSIEEAVALTGKDASTIRWYLREDAKPEKVLRGRLPWIGVKSDPADPGSPWAKIQIPTSFVIDQADAECASTPRVDAGETRRLQAEHQALREENARLQGRLAAQEARVQFLEQFVASEQQIRMALAQHGLALPAPASSAQEIPAESPTPAAATAQESRAHPLLTDEDPPTITAGKRRWWQRKK